MGDLGSTDLTAAIERFRTTMAEALDSLADALRQTARETRREQERLRKLENLVRQVTEEPRISGEAGTSLEELIGQLARKQREHDAWLSNLSQRLTSDRLSSDRLTGGEYLEHVEISDRYRRLIGQRLLDMAATYAPPGAVAEASARAGLARALFDPESIAAGSVRALEGLRHDGVPVPADRFQPLWDEAEEIRRDAESTGHRCRWLFDAEPGGAVDPSSQEVCEGCTAADPVVLVLAPAYEVDGRIHVKQVVFTQPTHVGPPSTDATPERPDSGEADGRQAPRPEEPLPAGTPCTSQPVAPSQGESLDEP